jgi:hypothetical protein
VRKIASIGIAIGTLAVAVLPVRAEDQQGRAASVPHGAVQRATSLPRASGEAYAGFAQGGAYLQTCSHIGGPKSGSWTCR